MLTFETSSVQGAAAITEKLAVRSPTGAQIRQIYPSKDTKICRSTESALPEGPPPDRDL